MYKAKESIAEIRKYYSRNAPFRIDSRAQMKRVMTMKNSIKYSSRRSVDESSYANCDEQKSFLPASLFFSENKRRENFRDIPLPPPSPPPPGSRKHAQDRARDDDELD
ncbi:hypothetical protein P5V15_014170 [Pogonomyrmex californicus]